MPVKTVFSLSGGTLTQTDYAVVGRRRAALRSLRRRHADDDPRC